MGRRRLHVPLRVYTNNKLVGYLTREANGATRFQYDDSWLNRSINWPISISLPLREDAYHGESVTAVFDNLLPDSEQLRKRIAQKVGARGTDAYSLLTRIGRDCVGALQFLSGDDEVQQSKISGEVVNDEKIEAILNNLAQAPLGLNCDEDFRISVAGAQEKTALLWHNDQWYKPHGTTPTTHIFKTQIGTLPNGINLTNSVENEFYCLALAETFDLGVNKASMATFGKTKALIIERFDRVICKDKIVRIPQEDCCQAMSFPPTLKYESDGGPGISCILNLLKGSNKSAEDQKIFLIAQILFWLIGATDGHAKNFSLFLTPGGGYELTPLYDILTTQPIVDKKEINHKQIKMAMAVGKSRYYRVDKISPRHFLQMAEVANIAESIVRSALYYVLERAEKAFEEVTDHLPTDFPEELHESVKTAALKRLQAINLSEI